MSLCPSEMKDFEALKEEREKSSYNTIKAKIMNASWQLILEADFLTVIENTMGINRKELVIRALDEVSNYFKSV